MGRGRAPRHEAQREAAVRRVRKRRRVEVHIVRPALGLRLSWEGRSSRSCYLRKRAGWCGLVRVRLEAGWGVRPVGAGGKKTHEKKTAR